MAHTIYLNHKCSYKGAQRTPGVQSPHSITVGPTGFPARSPMLYFGRYTVSRTSAYPTPSVLCLVSKRRFQGDLRCAKFKTAAENSDRPVRKGHKTNGALSLAK
jgi:hypothetical protein